jgi:glycosyltransferase involved in cell wall biosynthesis
VNAIDWHIISGEYPPQAGGVSDYTRLVARGLAEAGDAVTVWAPRAAGAEPEDRGVAIRRLPNRFGVGALRDLDAGVRLRSGPVRILVQYVPHAFGWKGLNVPFALWLRVRHHHPVSVMFHEVVYPVRRGESVSRNAFGIATHVMAALIGATARCAYVSTARWERLVRPIVHRSTPITHLPVPSTVPVVRDDASAAAIRAAYASDRALVGHFGTDASLVRPLLTAAILQMIETTSCRVLLLGKGSDAAASRIIDAHPRAAGRLHGTGALDADDLSRHIAACDVMVQPYPDGVTTRRTTAMAALAHGRALVTNSGALTDDLWRSSNAVALAEGPDPSAIASLTSALVADRTRRARLAALGLALYRSRFDLRHTIAALRSDGLPLGGLRAVS